MEEALGVGLLLVVGGCLLRRLIEGWREIDNSKTIMNVTSSCSQKQPLGSVLLQLFAAPGLANRVKVIKNRRQGVIVDVVAPSCSCRGPT